MSGHSKWAKTHRQKEASDAKKGAIFTRLGNLITIATKEGGGGDINSNFKLRLILEKARAANMPKENIDRAVKRGTGEGNDGVIFEEVTYEIFGPAGSTFIIEAITDNRNRTLSHIKTVLSKSGGQMGGPNSILWQFDRRGLIFINQQQLTDKNLDDLELSLIDLGAEDIRKNEEGWEIITIADKLQEVEKKIKDLDLEIEESYLGYIAKDDLKITEKETGEKIEKFYSALEDIEDVNNVFTNAS